MPGERWQKARELAGTKKKNPIYLEKNDQRIIDPQDLCNKMTDVWEEISKDGIEKNYNVTQREEAKTLRKDVRESGHNNDEKLGDWRPDIPKVKAHVEKGTIRSIVGLLGDINSAFTIKEISKALKVRSLV